MTSGNYRTSPLWNRARHLVLTLSAAADSFDTPAGALSRRIRNQSIHLLLEIVELHEARIDRHSVEQSIAGLERSLSESQKKGFLARTAFTRLRREVRALRSALKESAMPAGSGPESPIITKKFTLSSFTGALS